MPNEAMLAAVKAGLKGELDSVTVYEEAASKADKDVGAFFRERADEEKRHFNWLLSYYKELEGGGVPSANLAESVKAEEGRSPLITPDFLKRIAASRYLTAAVAAAALLEISAVRRYREAAESTSNVALSDFFSSLAEWEDRHYHDLIRVQEESERYWFDVQRFEPF